MELARNTAPAGRPGRVLAAASSTRALPQASRLRPTLAVIRLHPAPSECAGDPARKVDEESEGRISGQTRSPRIFQEVTGKSASAARTQSTNSRRVGPAGSRAGSVAVLPDVLVVDP